MAAAISDPLSQSFPYLIASVPWVFQASESRLLALATIEAGLPIAVVFFEALVAETWPEDPFP